MLSRVHSTSHVLRGRSAHKRPQGAQQPDRSASASAARSGSDKWQRQTSPNAAYTSADTTAAQCDTGSILPFAANAAQQTAQPPINIPCAEQGPHSCNIWLPSYTVPHPFLQPPPFSTDLTACLAPGGVSGIKRLCRAQRRAPLCVHQRGGRRQPSSVRGPAGR